MSTVVVTNVVTVTNIVIKPNADQVPTPH